MDRTVTNTHYFWVTLDGSRLHPGEYKVNGNEFTVSDTIFATLTASSLLFVTHITENTMQPSTGFRIFQDMNGNTEYLRLCKDATTFTTESAVPTSTKIYVNDASILPFVQPTSEAIIISTIYMAELPTVCASSILLDVLLDDETCV